MKTKNPMQLKAFINKMANEKNIHAQVVMQNYMMERFLERVSLSEYKNNLILKGGFLVAAIVGLDTRSTMDLDTTIKGIHLSKEAVQKIFNDICGIPLDDDFSFEVTSIQDIREADAYPGLKVGLRANYGKLSTPFNIDITAGDKITPREVSYRFKLMFETDKYINVLAYNLETVLAEKLQTIISRGIRNTRPRDFYDIYILYKLKGEEIDSKVLSRAVYETAKRRDTVHIMRKYKEKLAEIEASSSLFAHWQQYQTDFSYARDIAFQETCDAVRNALDGIDIDKLIQADKAKEVPIR